MATARIRVALARASRFIRTSASENLLTILGRLPVTPKGLRELLKGAATGPHHCGERVSAMSASGKRRLPRPEDPVDVRLLLLLRLLLGSGADACQLPGALEAVGATRH